MFHWSDYQKPIVALAPMAGVTDSAFRQIVKIIAPETLLYTEFVSTNALHYGSKKAHRMLKFDRSIENPLIVQIFGNDKKTLVEICTLVEEAGADGIDINMGCPASKIVSSCYGSALIRKPELACELVHEATKIVSIPISVKTRLGWESPDEIVSFGIQLEQAGAAAIAVHGRTYKQKYKGEANWEPIYTLKDAVSIPVIGNGDIQSGEDALRKIGNLDGVMIGRGSIGNPWLLCDVHNLLYEKKNRTEVTLQEKIDLLIRHYKIAVELNGEPRAILEMRKHASGYIKGFSGAKELRMQLMQIKTLPEVESVLFSIR